MKTFEYLMMFVIYILLLFAGIALLTTGVVCTLIATCIAAVTYFPCVILEKIWVKWC